MQSARAVRLSIGMVLWVVAGCSNGDATSHSGTAATMGSGGMSSGLGGGGANGAGGAAGNGGSGGGGQLWANLLDPSRAIDWTKAGVEGGIPNRTKTCATLSPGATAAQINAAIVACPAGQVVMLSAGTFAISDDGIVMKSGVVLRGAGADKTQLVFTAVNPCGGGNSSICFLGSNDWSGQANTQPGGANAADWTGGYAQHGDQITLSNVGSSGIKVGQYIYLDQLNEANVGPDFFVCDATQGSCSLEGGNGGRVTGGTLRSQIQIVKVTAIKGNTYTISPALYSPNWKSSLSPGAWWASITIENAGLEDLTVDATNSGGNANLTMFAAVNDWVKGVRFVRTCTCERDLIQVSQTTHCTIEDNYFYGTEGQSENYGVESYMASDILIQNNILQHVVAPFMVQPNLGSVYAYNYAINDTYDDGMGLHWMSDEVVQHNAGVEYNLYEGNVGPGMSGDVFHGNQLANTAFRNYFLGSDPTRVDATSCVNLLSYNRYFNYLGNVLGTPGYTTTYEANGGPGQSQTVFNLGGGNTEGAVTVADDPMVEESLLRWGNYDTATGSARFSAKEVPSKLTPYGNFIPKTQTLPPSFVYASKPSWWPSGKAWPPIGPDVTGGNISGLKGHANTIPAEDCYRKVMKGPIDGSGGVLEFNAAACYPAKP